MSVAVAVPASALDDGTAEEAVVGQWIYKDGAQVSEGEPLTEIMVVKSTYEILAPRSGQLEIVAPADSLVKKGDVLCRIH